MSLIVAVSVGVGATAVCCFCGCLPASWKCCCWRVKIIIFFMVLWSIWSIWISRQQQPPLFHSVVVQKLNASLRASFVQHSLDSLSSSSSSTTKATTPSEKSAFATSRRTRSSTISDDEWSSLLEMFRYMIRDSERELLAREEDEWLPVVIRSNGTMLMKKDHLKTIREFQRFRLFVPMTYSAIHFDINKAERLAFNFTSKRAETNVHLPLVKRDSVPLILAFGDMRNCFNLSFPRLSWSTVPATEPCRAIPIPGYNLYNERHGHSANASHFYATVEGKYPWSIKLRKAVWRGAATGHAPSGTWDSLPRAQLVNYSLENPDLLDAGFTTCGEFAERYPGQGYKLQHHSRFARKMPMDDYQKFRAIVDMDGNAWSARFGSLLCMNSVVIKVRAGNKNYFDDELEPWVHYIPVKPDLSDLMQSIRFAVSDKNTKIVKAMIFRANEWCRTQLTQQQFVIEMFWRLNSYIELLGDDPQRWQQWDKLLESFESQGDLVVVEGSEFGFRNDTSWLYKPLSQAIQAPINDNAFSLPWASKAITSAMNTITG